MPPPSTTVSFAAGLRPVLKHPGHPDQKVHGRRIPGTVDPDVAEKAIRLVGEYGGLSIKMTDGSEPESGFMVARDSKRYGTAVMVDEFYGPGGARILGEFLIRNRSELGSGRAYLGVWHQKTEKVDGVERPLPRKRQVVHLDVTDNVEGRERSISLGRRRDQISIWDVVNQDEIETGGKGAEVAKGSSDSTDPEGAVRDDGRGDHGLGGEGPRPTRGERPPGRLTPVGKHGQHDQSTHGRRGHALETGAHSTDATIGPAPRATVVKFAPGLRPVLKHGAHNQLTHGNRSSGGIDRADMPQIPKRNRERFLAELTTEGVNHADESVDPRSLRRTQRAINPKNVRSMYEAMRSGALRDEGPRIIVSSDDKVLDGHHRWAAASQIAADSPGYKIRVTRVDLPMSELLDRARRFNDEQGIEARSMEDIGPRVSKQVSLTGSVSGETGVTVRFAPGLRPVLKHGNHDQSSHGQWAAGRRDPSAPVTPQDIASAFEGQYTTDKGVKFSLVATTMRDERGPTGINPTAGGNIVAEDGAVIGEWARQVDGETMHALFLSVGKTIKGKPVEGTEDYRGKGIALEIQKQTEKAAKRLGCTHIEVHAAQDGIHAWAQERFGYSFTKKPDIRGNAKPGREPKTDQERQVAPGEKYVDRSTSQYMWKGSDGLIYSSYDHRDKQIPEVRAQVQRVLDRFESSDPDSWPKPYEVLRLGTGLRVYDDAMEGMTLGEFLLSRAWTGVKSSDHVTKAVGMLTVKVWGPDDPYLQQTGRVAKHLAGQHDQATHGSGGASAIGGELYARAAEWIQQTQFARAAEGRPDYGPSDSIPDDYEGRLKGIVANRIAEGMADVPAVDMVEAAFPRIGDPGAGGEQRRQCALALQDRPDVRVWLSAQGNIVTVREDEIDERIARGLALPPNPRQAAIAGSPEAEHLVRRAAVSRLVNQWAATSNDQDAMSLAIQDAADLEFGIKSSVDWEKTPYLQREIADLKPAEAVYRRFVREQYDQTQAMFKDMGVDSVSVFRGMRLPYRTSDEIFGAHDVADTEPWEATSTVAMRPLSSWSTDTQQAARFALISEGRAGVGVVIESTVPISSVLSTSFTGNGCHRESEVVLVGKEIRGNVFTVEAARASGLFQDESEG